MGVARWALPDLSDGSDADGDLENIRNFDPFIPPHVGGEQQQPPPPPTFPSDPPTSSFGDDEARLTAPSPSTTVHRQLHGGTKNNSRNRFSYPLSPYAFQAPTSTSTSAPGRRRYRPFHDSDADIDGDEDPNLLPPPPPLPTTKPPSDEAETEGRNGRPSSLIPAAASFLVVGDDLPPTAADNFSEAGDGLFDDGVAVPTEVDVRISNGVAGRRPEDGGSDEDDGEDVRLDAASAAASGILTTVPPCMVRDTIATETGTMRHVPTRSSLRHSRMLVNNTKVQPGRITRGGFAGFMARGAVIRDYRLGASLACIQLLLGLLQVGLACWILLVLGTPSTSSLHHREVPHWSGAFTTASGFIGLILMCCCPKETLYQYKATYATKILSVIFTTGSVIACLCAAGFAAVHLVYLADTSCVEISTAPSSSPSPTEDPLVPAGVGSVTDPSELVPTSSSSSPVPPSGIPVLPREPGHASAMLATSPAVGGDDAVVCECRTRRRGGGGGGASVRRLAYAGLTCARVRAVLGPSLIAVCVACGAAALASAGYLCLLWAGRYYYVPAGASSSSSSSGRIRPSSSASSTDRCLVGTRARDTIL